ARSAAVAAVLNARQPGHDKAAGERIAAPSPSLREYEVKPTGRVESPLADPAQAPSQGGEGAPPA
ncbi:MAG TPA: hypothetical protein VJ351_06910, partial [Streptosporangiaceae bacterium]|nr:hypothetical protein [Streptosporangiaceae bacterium]